MKITILLLIIVTLSSGQEIVKNKTSSDGIPYSKSLFGGKITANIRGTAQFVTPLDGCGQIAYSYDYNNIAIIKRGNCSFTEKVLNAQKSNYIAVIIYDNVTSENLISMNDCTSGTDIFISSIFISASSSLLINNNSYIIIKYDSFDSIFNIGDVLVIVIPVLFVSLCCILLIVRKYNQINIRNNQIHNVNQQNNVLRPHIDINFIIEKINAPCNVSDNASYITMGDNTSYSSNNSNMNACLICNTTTNESSYKFKSSLNGGCDCNIIFHKNCMSSWFANNPSCPTCRKTYTI